MKIKVLRAFIHNGDPVDADAVIDVSDAFGKEMIGCNKAESAEPKAPPSGPLDTTNAGAIVSGRQGAEK